jgi:hypothetical protein
MTNQGREAMDILADMFSACQSQRGISNYATANICASKPVEKVTVATRLEALCSTQAELRSAIEDLIKQISPVLLLAVNAQNLGTAAPSPSKNGSSVGIGIEAAREYELEMIRLVRDVIASVDL